MKKMSGDNTKEYIGSAGPVRECEKCHRMHHTNRPCPDVQPNSPPQRFLIAKVDVPAFLAFKDNQEVVRILAESGVFKVQQGKVTLNIHNGQIQSVHVDERRFQRVSGGNAPSGGKDAP